MSGLGQRDHSETHRQGLPGRQRPEPGSEPRHGPGAGHPGPGGRLRGMIHQTLQFWPQYNTILMKGRDNMDSKKPTGENRVKFDDTQTVPLAYHEMCMTRNHKTVLRLFICWALSVVLVVGIFAYMWLQYDYVSSTEYSGVYNIT